MTLTKRFLSFGAVQGGSVAYLLVGGGAAGFDGYRASGGAGGGVRSSYDTEASGGPDGVVEEMLSFSSGTTYTITVGAGGARLGSGAYPTWAGTGGVSSISGSDITTITTTGSNHNSGGTSRDEGYLGGGGNTYGGGGGGGAGEAGSASGAYTYRGGDGGDGQTSSITGSSVVRGGGAGGIGNAYGSTTPSSGGAGGGADGILPYGRASVDGNDGTDGLGGGGTGRNLHPSFSGYTGGAGGSGCVILRMPTAEYSGTVTGSPSVTTSGTDTIIHWTGSGTYTH